MKHRYGRTGLVTRPGTLSLMLLLALGAGAPLAGCVSEQVERSDTEQVGSLGFNLEVASGVTLNTVSYTIQKGDFEKSGTIDVGDAPTISGTIGGIPAGEGYTITLVATSIEDETAFTGSASFDVIAGETTSVTIHLKGAGASDNGSVAVNATLNVGPVIDELTATPVTVFVGGTVTLSGVGTDPDEGPSPVSLYDLLADPLETTDLYSSAAHAAVRAALEAEIATLALDAPEGYFP